MSFKDQLAADIAAVFLNINEFAEVHTIDGQPNIKCVIEDKYIPNPIDGVYVKRRQLFINEPDLGYRPVPDQRIMINDDYWYVVDCTGEDLLEVTLEAHES